VAGASRRRHDEYRNPVEFFRRTYLTESLKEMLVGAGAARLTAGGGDPVVQLQTNFGGGKTHSMLALYHLFSGIAPTELPGIDEVMQAAGAKGRAAQGASGWCWSATRFLRATRRPSPMARWCARCGANSPGNSAARRPSPACKADDENATSPGDVLRELFNEYGPCLILVDEWVAYARQLHDQSDLPAGGFETQFTFAQVLTESAKLAKNCLLVISLPASDTSGLAAHSGRRRGGRRHARARGARPAAQRGRACRIVVAAGECRRRLRDRAPALFSRCPTRRSSRTATWSRAPSPTSTARSRQEFPPECRESEYEKRIKAAYPIHPEIFDRLYTDWSTLVKFQRTRGVLRLMAAVIHSLWEKGDRNPLILPATCRSTTRACSPN
jgi:hypothetical protein